MSPFNEETQEEALVGQQAAFEDEQEPEEDGRRGDSYESIRCRHNRAIVREAYGRYAEDPSLHEGALLEAVKTFATGRLYSMEHDFRGRGTAATVDDVAQCVLVDIWNGLERRPDRTPEMFLHWLVKTCAKRLRGACGELREELDQTPSFDANPATLKSVAGIAGRRTNPDPIKGTVIPTYAIDRGFVIPAWVQGTDRCICELILDGRTYKQIANELDMPLGTVKNKMSALRKKVLDTVTFGAKTAPLHMTEENRAAH